MNEQVKFPAGTVFGSIGHPIRRKEDARLLTGQGRFSDDFNLERQAHAAIVRSPHPHARIVRIDTDAAKAMPGVLAVLTGADCKADGLKPILTKLLGPPAATDHAPPPTGDPSAAR